MGTAPPRFDGQVVLAVFAHPDDESLACGGTLARLADAGAHVVVLCATHGENGPGRAEHGEALGSDRATELQGAAARLGVRELVLLDYRDGYLRWGHVADFLSTLILFMRHRRPAAVITFDSDGLYWHPDHIGVHERVLAAAQALGPAAPPIYGVTIRNGVMSAITDLASEDGWAAPEDGFWSLPADAFGKFAPEHTLVVDVAEWVPRKLSALASHESQMGAANPFSRLTAEDARRWLGSEFFRRVDQPPHHPALLEHLCTPDC